MSNSLRRIGDDLRTFLFDAIFGGVRLAHEFADRLQRGKIDALAAGKVQREELQLPASSAARSLEAAATANSASWGRRPDAGA